MVVAAKEGAARAEALNRYDCETFVSVASRVGSLRELAIRGLGDLDAGQRVSEERGEILLPGCARVGWFALTVSTT